MKRLQALAPLATTIVGGVFFSGLSFATLCRLSSLQERVLAGLALLIYVLWMAWESKVSRRELKKAYADYDNRTMEVAAFTKMTTLAVAFALTTRVIPQAAVLGLLLMLAGIALRTTAIRQLGEHYSHRIRPLEVLWENGVYAWVRHPAYLGTFITHLGLVMVFLNAWSVASCLILWGGAVILRAYWEERLLQKDPRYQNYAKKTRSKLIPGLW